MTHMKSLISRACLAAALLTGAGVASALPIYHVDIKTSGFDTSISDAAYLDLYFVPFGTVGSVTATVTKLTGDFTGDPVSNGVTTGPDGALTFVGDYSTDYLRTFKLGKDISFDVSFDGLPSETGTTGFHADLINGDFSDYLSTAVSFTLLPDATDIASDGGVGSTTTVPEPSAAALLLIGLMATGAVARRRS